MGGVGNRRPCLSIYQFMLASATLTIYSQLTAAMCDQTTENSISFPELSTDLRLSSTALRLRGSCLAASRPLTPFAEASNSVKGYGLVFDPNASRRRVMAVRDLKGL